MTTEEVRFTPGDGAAVVQPAEETPPSAPEAPMGEGGKPQMPEGGHEKYWDADKGQYNWEAHAREQDWQRQQKAQQTETAETGEAIKEGDEVAAQAAEAAGVNIDEFNAYVAEHGKVNPEHLKKFEAAGIPPEAVEEYVQLKVDAVERHVTSVKDFFGGETAFSKVNQYLVQHYTREEIEAFNEQLSTPGTWRVTASFLMQEAGMPRPGRGVIKPQNAQTGGTAKGESFANEAEFSAAMRDPRYKADPAYRTRVQNALRNSPHLL